MRGTNWGNRFGRSCCYLSISLSPVVVRVSLWEVLEWVYDTPKYLLMWINLVHSMEDKNQTYQ